MRLTLITPETYPNEKPVLGHGEELHQEEGMMEETIKEDSQGDHGNQSGGEDTQAMLDLYCDDADSDDGNRHQGDSLDKVNGKRHILAENNNNVASDKCRDMMADRDECEPAAPKIPSNLLFSDEAANISSAADESAHEASDNGEADPNIIVIMPEAPPAFERHNLREEDDSQSSSVHDNKEESPSSQENIPAPQRSSVKIFQKKERKRMAKPDLTYNPARFNPYMIPSPLMSANPLVSMGAMFNANIPQPNVRPESVESSKKKRRRKQVFESRDTSESPHDTASPNASNNKDKNNESPESKASVSPHTTKGAVDPHLAMWTSMWNPYLAAAAFGNMGGFPGAAGASGASPSAMVNMAAAHNLSLQQQLLSKSGGELVPQSSQSSPREKSRGKADQDKAANVAASPVDLTKRNGEKSKLTQKGFPSNLRASPVSLFPSGARDSPVSGFPSGGEMLPQEEAIDLCVKKEKKAKCNEHSPRKVDMPWGVSHGDQPSAGLWTKNQADEDMNKTPTDIHPAFKNWARGYSSDPYMSPMHPGYENGTPLRKGCTRTRERWRVTYSEVQTNALEMEFQFNRFVKRERRFALSQRIGLTERQIKIWFQNRRMKQKKEDKRRDVDTGFSEHTKTSLLDDIKFIMSPNQKAARAAAAANQKADGNSNENIERSATASPATSQQSDSQQGLPLYNPPPMSDVLSPARSAAADIEEEEDESD